MSETDISTRRDQVVVLLGDAWAADVIGEQEFDRRVQAAFDAREPAALDHLVSDLPQGSALVASDGAGSAPLASALAFRRVALGSVDEHVRGVVPTRMEFGVRLGSLELDFTRAIFQPGVTELVIDTIMGSIEIVLPANVALDSHVNSILSAYEYKGQPRVHAGDVSVVRLTGRALLSSVEIKPTLLD